MALGVKRISVKFVAVLLTACLMSLMLCAFLIDRAITAPLVSKGEIHIPSNVLDLMKESRKAAGQSNRAGYFLVTIRLKEPPSHKMLPTVDNKNAEWFALYHEPVKYDVNSSEWLLDINCPDSWDKGQASVIVQVGSDSFLASRIKDDQSETHFANKWFNVGLFEIIAKRKDRASFKAPFRPITARELPIGAEIGASDIVIYPSIKGRLIAAQFKD